jgi:hypothetical protein
VSIKNFIKDGLIICNDSLKVFQRYDLEAGFLKSLRVFVKELLLYSGLWGLGCG